MGIRVAIPALLVACGLAALPAVGHPGLDIQIADLTARLEREPGSAALHLQRGEVHRAHRDWAEAEADYVAARRLDSELAVVDLAMGRMCLEAARPGEAKAALDRFLLRQPQHPEALAFRGRALVLLGQPLAAAEEFTRALAASDANHRGRVDFYLERARALASVEPPRLDPALQGLDEGIKSLGGPVTLQLYAIDLELRLRRFDAALERVEHIARESARKEPWLIQRGQILEKAGRPEAARQAYADALAAIQALPPARKGNRAVQGMAEQARSALERVSSSGRGGS